MHQNDILIQIDNLYVALLDKLNEMKMIAEFASANQVSPEKAGMLQLRIDQLINEVDMTNLEIERLSALVVEHNAAAGETEGSMDSVLANSLN